MPNPLGRDEKNEWLKIQNIGPEKNINSLQIVAISKNSKKKIISKEKNIHFLADETKVFSVLNLPNTEATVLLLVNGTESDRINYTTAPENMIFKKYTLQQSSGGLQENWRWQEIDSQTENLIEKIVLADTGQFATLVGKNKINDSLINAVLTTDSSFKTTTTSHTQTLTDLKLITQQKTPIPIPGFNGLIWPVLLALIIFLILATIKIDSCQKIESGRFAT